MSRISSFLTKPKATLYASISCILVGALVITGCGSSESEKETGAETQQAQALLFAFGPPGVVIGAVITTIAIGGIIYQVFKYNPKKNTLKRGATGGFGSAGHAEASARRAAKKAADQRAEKAREDNGNNWYLVHNWKTGNSENWAVYIGPSALNNCELDAFWHNLNMKPIILNSFGFNCQPYPVYNSPILSPEPRTKPKY